MSTIINIETIIEAIDASLERILNNQIDDAILNAKSVDEAVKEVETLLNLHEKRVELFRNYFETYPEKEETE